MDNTYFIVGGALVFLVVLWIAVGLRHLNFLKKGVDGSWEFLDEKIRNRHDVSPVLVEIIRADALGSSDLDKYVAATVETRDQARRIYFASGEKTEKEYSYSKALSDLIWFGDEHDVVSKNTYFLELKKEIEGLNSDIENRSKEYNEHVVRFNSDKKIFILKPLVMVTRMKQALIFEFEK